MQGCINMRLSVNFTYMDVSRLLIYRYKIVIDFWDLGHVKESREGKSTLLHLYLRFCSKKIKLMQYYMIRCCNSFHNHYLTLQIFEFYLLDSVQKKKKS